MSEIGIEMVEVARRSAVLLPRQCGPPERPLKPLDQQNSTLARVSMVFGISPSSKGVHADEELFSPDPPSDDDGAPRRGGRPVGEGGAAKKTVFAATMEVISFTSGMMPMMSYPALWKGTGDATFGLFALAVVACIITGWVLGIILEHAQARHPSPDYASVSMMTFGPLAGSIITAMAVADCGLYIVALFIMMGVSMAQFLPVSQHLALQLSACLAAAVHVLPGKMLRKTRAWCSVTTLLACVLVLLTGLMLSGAKFEPPPLKPSNLMDAFGVAFYGCAFHVYYPAIYNSVPSRSEYNKAIVLGNSLFALLGCGFGYATYALFGSAVEPIASNNIGRDFQQGDLKYLGWTRGVVNVLIYVKNLFVLKPAVGPILSFVMKPVLPQLPCLRGYPLKVANWSIAAAAYLTLSSAADSMADFIIPFERAVALVLYSSLAIIFPLMCYMRLIQTDFILYNICIAGVVFGYVLFALGILACFGVL